MYCVPYYRMYWAWKSLNASYPKEQRTTQSGRGVRTIVGVPGGSKTHHSATQPKHAASHSVKVVVANYKPLGRLASWLYNYTQLARPHRVQRQHTTLNVHTTKVSQQRWEQPKYFPANSTHMMFCNLARYNYMITLSSANICE